MYAACPHRGQRMLATRKSKRGLPAAHWKAGSVLGLMSRITNLKLQLLKPLITHFSCTTTFSLFQACGQAVGGDV